MFKTTLLVTSTLLVMPGFAISPTLAQTPSLGDGIMCAARGKTPQGNRIYLYTSLIDDASIKKKQPVSITMVEPASDIVEGEVVVIDKKSQSVYIDAFAAETAPQMQPVGSAVAIYQGKNTFVGKSKAGKTVSFTLENNNRTFKIKHGDETYTGVCH